jgi:YidC/Oxa1 family membrane protein insertase
MDRNTWIGLALIFAILFGWSYFTKPSAEELAEQQRVQDSIATVRQQEQLERELKKKQYEAKASFEDSDVVENDTMIAQKNEKQYGAFGNFATGEKEFYTIENDVLRLTLTNLGGRVYSAELKNYKTHDSLPLLLFDGDSTVFSLNFFSNNKSIATDKLFFEYSESLSKIVVDGNKRSVSFKLPVSDKDYLEYVYTLYDGQYMVDFDVNLVGMDNYITSNTGYISLDWQSYLRSLERGQKWETDNSSIHYRFADDEVESLSPRSDEVDERLTTKVQWIAYKQQFFSTALIAKNNFNNAIIRSSKNVSNPVHLKHFASEISLPYDGKPNETIPMQFYFGPNHYKTMKQYDIELEELITLGRSIIRWVNVGVVIPLFNFLGSHIASYGLIILLLTIIIKIAIFPFTYKSYMSSAKMKALKPEVDKIGEKFPKKEDAMKKQQATMALYKQVGVSPMGGCLPMLFQMPILIAMFRFFPNSIELRQQSFLWATDLSTYDSIITLPFTVPMGFGDHISLFTLLMTIVNLIYMKTNDQMNMSNQQMPGMKTMMYMMPIMMLFWFNSYASALSYYYFLSLLITILQTWLIRRTINDEEILAKLQAAKANKKAPKKSKFQQRLEDMAKQRGVQPPKR